PDLVSCPRRAASGASRGATPPRCRGEGARKERQAMKSPLSGGRFWRRAAQLCAASLAIVGTGLSSGCLSRPREPIEPKTTSVVTERLTESSVDKIDLLFMIDNSSSMADKQKILAAAVPDLVRGLVNPRCVITDPMDPKKTVPAAMQPAGPLDP